MPIGTPLIHSMDTSFFRSLCNAVSVLLAIGIGCGLSWAQEYGDFGNATNLNRAMYLELEQQLSIAPPETKDPQELCVFHHKRGMAYARLGRYDPAISDLKLALSLNQPSRLTPDYWGDRWRIENDLKTTYASSGNDLMLLEYLDVLGAEYIQANPRRYFFTRLWLMVPYIHLGMLKEAEEALQAATDLLPGLRIRRDWSFNEHNISEMHAEYSAMLKEIRGNHAEAERLRRIALENARQWLPQMQRVNSKESQLVRLAQQNVIGSTRALASTLSAQNKLGEAELLAHEVLRNTLAYSSFNTTGTSGALSTLRGIRLQQGNLTDAARYGELSLQSMEKADVQAYSWTLAERRSQIGLIQVMQSRWNDALSTYDIRDRGLRSNPEQFAKRGSADLDWGLALLRAGQGRRAVGMLQGELDDNLKKSFVDPIHLAHLRGYLATALSEQGQDGAALALFGEALPVLLKQARDADLDNDAGFVNTYRLRVVIEGYLELLGRRHGARKDVADLDIVSEAFKLADLARNSSVQRAVTSSAARATLPDAQLAQLARREQDANNQKHALNRILALLASAPEERRLQKVINDMQRDIERLASEQVTMRKELLERFPEYAALIDPRPATPAEIQKLLRRDEAVISLYSGERRTYVWTITPDTVSFRMVPLSRNQIDREVRKVLDSVDLTTNESKPFDAVASQYLYANLLAPDAGKWSAAHLINIIPHGTLGQLPFALLLTEPFKVSNGAIPVVYAEQPWLIKKTAIAQQSSASSFVALRQAAPTKAERKPFVGFGDPLFMANAVAGTQRGTRVRSLQINHSNDETLNFLERAQGSEKPLDNAMLRSRPSLNEAFSLLPPLPDTAEELKEISLTLGGDVQNDLYLGARATETNVKTADLSRYRVLAFATHGLVPGELSGLDQPALALANPALTRESNSDGFLTLEEVLGLKLNADWVVLSACNTASADGNASEAVSGLGRAFFYAGTRSLLVSNWAVETVSARLLTTELFRQQSDNPTMTRAEALRQSMLTVMMRNPGDYAHPGFWAPFSLVGDGLLQ